MSHVLVSFLGPMRKPKGLGAQARLPLPDDGTVGALLTELGYSPEEQSRLRVMLGGHNVSLDHEVKEDHELTIFLPLGGG